MNIESKKVENCLQQSIEISGIVPVNAALRYGMDTVDSVIAAMERPSIEREYLHQCILHGGFNDGKCPFCTCER